MRTGGSVRAGACPGGASVPLKGASVTRNASSVRSSAFQSAPQIPPWFSAGMPILPFPDAAVSRKRPAA